MLIFGPSNYTYVLKVSEYCFKNGQKFANCCPKSFARPNQVNFLWNLRVCSAFILHEQSKSKLLCPFVGCQTIHVHQRCHNIALKTATKTQIAVQSHLRAPIQWIFYEICARVARLFCISSPNQSFLANSWAFLLHICIKGVRILSLEQFQMLKLLLKSDAHALINLTTSAHKSHTSEILSLWYAFAFNF